MKIENNPFKQLVSDIEPSADGSKSVINRIHQIKAFSVFCGHFSIGMVKIIGELVSPGDKSLFSKEKK